MKLSSPFRGTAVSAARLRQEIFALGDRHRGDALAGARLELDDPRLTAERRGLLRAVVAHLSAGGETGEGVAARDRPRRSGVADAAYVGVIVGAAAWAAVVVKSLMG
jgi:hypothetical protein